VAIVNEALASRFWPDGRAVGRRVQVVDETTPREVIGVVANARFASFGDRVGPLILLPARQRGGSQLTLHVRSASPPSSVLSDIVRLASALDPNVAIQKGTTMRAAMAFSLFPAEVARAVFGIAALIGIVLASCGVYALVSYTCEQRLKDVGVMVALGASPRHVFRTVVGGTLVFVSIGLLAGAIIAGGAMRVFRSLLYGVSSWDPLTFAAVAIGLAGIALAAGVAAARKGLRLDPVVALRDR
jgi:ABC-type antimicrobial peptide transport system permease subunit